MRLPILVATALLLVSNAAEARPHHHHRGHHATRHVAHHRHINSALADVHRVERSSGDWHFGSLASSLVQEARSQIGNGAIYGRASLWCARFMNFVLERTGHKGTGSDLAASFASYGHRVSGPQPGAIAVMARKGGGHVGIVSGVDNSGNPILISGNNRNRVREAPVSRGRVYAYVMPN